MNYKILSFALSILFLVVLVLQSAVFFATANYKNLYLQTKDSLNKVSQEEVNIENNLEEVAEESDYTIKEDGSLWYGEEKLDDESLIGFVQYIKDRRLDYFSEWLRYEMGDHLFLYVNKIRECGGCASAIGYFDINKKTGEYEFVENMKLAKLTFGIKSPDNKQVVYLEGGSPFTDEDNETKEVLKVYNLVINQEKELIKIPENATLYGCGDGCYLDMDLVKWMDNNYISVKPGIKDDNGQMVSYYLEGVTKKDLFEK